MCNGWYLVTGIVCSAINKDRLLLSDVLYVSSSYLFQWIYNDQITSVKQAFFRLYEFVDL